MGLIKTVKTIAAGADAKRARDERHTIYVHRFGMPGIGTYSSSSVSGAADVIEIIERVGWKLEHMTFSAETRAQGALVMMFRAQTLLDIGLDA